MPTGVLHYITLVGLSKSHQSSRAGMAFQSCQVKEDRSHTLELTSQWLNVPRKEVELLCSNYIKIRPSPSERHSYEL